MQIRTVTKNINAYKIALQVKESIHSFLKANRFLELDLPVLSPSLVPESYLEIFKTDFIYQDKKEQLFLTPSPELFLKRALAYGVGDCYYLGKSFRNSDLPSQMHSYEFTMLEFYKVAATYLDVADIVLNMIRSIARQIKNTGVKTIKNKNSILYQRKLISLEKWEKLTVAEAFKKYANISNEELFSHTKLSQKAKRKGYIVKGFSYEDIFSQIYTQEVEPHLGMNGFPTLLYDYPKEFAALAKLNPDGKTAQRFEFYIAGIEMGDCYTELTDWKEQLTRFEDENKKRIEGGRIAHPIDKGFIEALQYGLAPCAGIAIGFERLAMLFADVSSIEETKLITIS